MFDYFSFISTVISAVLTYHLAWVPTVTPTGGTTSKKYMDKHSAKWVSLSSILSRNNNIDVCVLWVPVCVRILFLLVCIRTLFPPLPFFTLGPLPSLFYMIIEMEINKWRSKCSFPVSFGCYCLIFFYYSWMPWPEHTLTIPCGPS